MSRVTYLGPLGGLLAVRSPAPNIPASRARPTSVQRTLDGNAYVQLGQLSGREFTWSIVRSTPAEIDNLVALWHGTYGKPPFYWYEPLSAVVNMLKPEAASPFAVDGKTGWSLLSGTGPLADGGAVAPYAHSLSIPTVSTTAISAVAPILPGRSYAAWGVVTTAGSELFTAQVVFCDAAGAVLAGGEGTVSTAATGIRSWATTVTGAAPANAAGVRVKLISPAGASTVRVPIVRLAETTVPLTRWHHGRGLPEVAITYVPETLQQGWGATRSDYQVSLVEV